MNTILQSAYKDIELNEQDEAFEISILAGEKVLAKISDSVFLAKWEDLYQACPWGTVFQSREFVCAWYRLYHLNFMPVIVKAELNGRLVGLLTLTIEKEKRLMMAAGLGAAEYQTWLAAPSYSDLFITKTLKKLRALYPGYNINLYNAPPDTPLEWARVDKYWHRHCQTKALKRPLMNLKDPEVTKLFRKKQFREKTNRLKRLGNLSFEKITTTKQFEAILDGLAAQSDFRKGAKFNHTEFLNDKARRQFLMELFSQGVLHTTVLKLDNHIIASIAACTGRGTVHLAGINTHSPLLSKYSPGTINFIMLGQLLMSEGIDTFDLTPGGDAYKERLATSHDFVHDIYISSRFATFLKRKIKEPFADLVKLNLRRYGITPRVLKENVIKIRSRVVLASTKNPTSLFSWRYLTKGFEKNQEVIEYIPQHTGEPTYEPISFNINSLQDLLLYNQQDGFVIRWDFLEDAMRRFEEGHSVYTITKSGSLIFCAWSKTDYIQPHKLSNPSDLVILDGIFCQPEVKDHISELLHNMARIVYPEYKALQCLIDRRYL